MLLIDQRAHERGEIFGLEPIGVVGLVRAEDRAAVIDVADDVRIRAPAVLRLHVEEDTAVADVRVRSGDHPPLEPPPTAPQSSALPATCRLRFGARSMDPEGFPPWGGGS